MTLNYEDRELWTADEWNRWAYVNPNRKPRGYTNVCKADTENVASNGTVEKVPRSDVKVRERFLKREGGQRVWGVRDCRPGPRAGEKRDYQLESAIDAVHCLATLRLDGAVVPDTVMTTLTVQAIYDTGWEGPVR